MLASEREMPSVPLVGGALVGLAPSDQVDPARTKRLSIPGPDSDCSPASARESDADRLTRSPEIDHLGDEDDDDDRPVVMRPFTLVNRHRFNLYLLKQVETSEIQQNI
jgi:hypothetical protein